MHLGDDEVPLPYGTSRKQGYSTHLIYFARLISSSLSDFASSSTSITYSSECQIKNSHVECSFYRGTSEFLYSELLTINQAIQICIGVLDLKRAMENMAEEYK